MAETLTLISPQDSENETIDLDTFRRRLMQLKKSRESQLDSSKTSVSDSKKSIEELATEFLGKLEEIDMLERLQTLDSEDFDAYMEQLKKEISLTEEENMKLSSEINNLARAVEGDSDQLDADLEKMAFSLKVIDLQVGGTQQLKCEAREFDIGGQLATC